MAYDIKIKSRGFNPNPFANGKIPLWADSINNPGCTSTKDYYDWWNEQFDLCVNGITTGGVYIPGRFYFYLNFYKISTLGRGLHSPDYVDFDLEYFELIEEAKRSGNGLIFLKSRRKGASEKIGSVIRHGCLFTPEKYMAGIVAGRENYSEELALKFTGSNATLPPEMRVHTLKDTVSETMLGWAAKTSTGYVNKGSGNRVMIKTMFSKTGVMKGYMYDDVVFEESGENDLLIGGYADTKPCLMVGDKVVGTSYIQGTGGNIKTSSAGFREMWFNAEDFGLLKIECFAQRLRVGFFIGSRNEKDELVEQCPNIERVIEEKSLSREQVLGCEDIDAALEGVRQTIDKAKTGSVEKYYKTLQNSATNEQEAFLNYTGNDYDTELLNSQLLSIAANPNITYRAYEPQWVYEDKTNNLTGEISKQLKIPHEVTMRLITDITDPALKRCIFILKHPPAGNVQNLFCAGLDGYDIDQTTTSKSLGAMVVMTRQNALRGYISRQPVALIYCRPPRKEEFYNLCLAAAVYYNLNNDVLCDARTNRVIEYFDNNQGKRFLAYRPRAFESDRSGQIHEFGFRETPFSKPTKLSIVQSWVVDCIQDCWFEPIVKDILQFDKEKDESDWDSHDAIGLALIQLINNPIVVLDHSLDVSGYDPFASVIYGTNGMGGSVIMNQNQLTPQGTTPVDSDDYSFNPFG